MVSPILALSFLTNLADAHQATMGEPPLSDSEMADCILAAAMAVCKRLGDPAAMRTIGQVREIAASIGKDKA